MRSLVVGGAGFIGSHLVDRLVSRGPVTILDDLSAGQLSFVQGPLASGHATLVRGDARRLEDLLAVAPGHDILFHLAANPEARRGLVDTRLDLELGTIATYNALEAARRASIPRFVLASSGTVYGETTKVCAESDLGALPISLYGASKMAGEALVSAFVECFDLRAHIFRFANVVGPRGTHGAILDFLRKLKQTPDRLDVLGDGSQTKPYLHVTDCVDAILFALDHADGRAHDPTSAPPHEPPPEVSHELSRGPSREPSRSPSHEPGQGSMSMQGSRLHVLNIAPPDTTSVREIAALCVAASPSPGATIVYQPGDRGWKGDIPRSRMDGSRLETMGFRLRNTSLEAVKRAVDAVAREVFGEAPSR